MSSFVAGKQVGPIGFGCMSLTNHFQPVPQEQALDVLRAAIQSGATFLNGGWFYGTPDNNSLHLLNKYFTKYPEDADKVVISIKACFDFATRMPMVDAASVRKEIEQCLRVADGKFKIDIFQAGRLDADRNVSVEETVGAIADFVKAGKIGSIGLSECSADSIRKAVAVHPVSAVEVEVSLFTTEIFTNGVAEACKENNIPIIAYSPLGRGLLTGRYKKAEELEGSFRAMFPRFQKGNFEQNMKLVDEVEKVAAKKGCTISQVAIAWVAQKGAAVGATIIPLPGTARVEKVKENVELMKLNAEEMEEINEVLGRIEVKGDRYPEAFKKFLNV